MFGTRKVGLPVVLYQQAVESAELGGYADVRELIHHAVEREIERIRRVAEAADGTTEATEDEKKVIKRLEGLGYFG